MWSRSFCSDSVVGSRVIQDQSSQQETACVDEEPLRPISSAKRIRTINQLKLPKVLLVAASPRIMGGHSVMAERLIDDLTNDGFQVGFIPVDSLPGCLQFVGKLKYLRTIVNTAFYLCFLLCRVWKYDIVHIFSASYWSFLISPAPAIVVAKLYRKKVILHYHSGEAEDHLQRSGWLVHWLLKLPDQIVVPSQFLVEVFSRFGLSTVAIANNIDLNTFAFRERHIVRPRIIVARALEPPYNVSCAIRAFKIIRNCYRSAQLTVLGSGSLRRQLEDEVTSLDLKGVVFTGRIEHDELPDIYDVNDIFLNTSSIDNMPVSILEAFASGLPVVTTAAGGIPYIVKHGVSGRVVNLDDHEAVASEILRLCETPSLATELSIAGKRELQKYTWETVGANWKSLYSELYNKQL